jgi:signal transduction histidine kinase
MGRPAGAEAPTVDFGRRPIADRPLRPAPPPAYPGGMTGQVTLPPTTVDLPTLLPSSLLASAGPAGARRRRTLRDWLVDVGCFLISVILGAVLVANEQQSSTPMSDRRLVLDVAIGSVCCLGLWWRRRWPIGLAVITVLAGAVSLMSAVAGMAALFTVAVHRKAWVAAVVGAAGLATMPIFLTLHPPGETPTWADATTGLLISAVVLGWGMFTRARRQLLLSLQDRALRAESEQQLRVDQARRMERARIAREMHDVLAHRISLLSVHAGALEFRTDATRQQVVEAAGVIRANAHQALQELREVIGVLREDDADAGPAGQRPGAPEPPQPGLAEIPALVAESSGAGATVRYRCEVAEPGEVPRSLARTAYRVVQEGLTNARKHAPGTPIEVSLRGATGTELAVEVVNPVRAWPPRATVPGSGLGLIGLAERVQLTGGRLDHGRDAQGSFRLRASLPWPR